MVEQKRGGQRKPTDFSSERQIAMWTAVGIIAVVLYLVIRNKPFASPDLVVLIRTVLSLGVAIVGATIPGFLQVKYDLAGFSIRAAGALGLFVLTFMFTPTVASLNLRAATTELGKIDRIDFRTSALPDEPESNRGQGRTLVTARFSVRSTEEPARTATLEKTSVKFVDSTEHECSWRNFVRMHEEREGVWLGIDDDAHPISIPAGNSVSREILHECPQDYRWQDFISFVEASALPSWRVEVNADVGDNTLSGECIVDLPAWRNQVAAFRQTSGKLPGRITFSCITD